MSDQWFYAKDGQQHGPVPISELRQLGSSGVLQPTDYVWSEGMTDWIPAQQVAGVIPRHEAPPSPQPPPNMPPTMDRADIANKKMMAGVFAILLGWLGVHKFILGMTGTGIIMLLATILSCGIIGTAMWVIGIIEGIIYLSKSEDEFYREYIVNKKAWF